jgi:hypothetical protein
MPEITDGEAEVINGMIDDRRRFEEGRHLAGAGLQFAFERLAAKLLANRNVEIVGHPHGHARELGERIAKSSWAPDDNRFPIRPVPGLDRPHKVTGRNGLLYTLI